MVFRKRKSFILGLAIVVAGCMTYPGVTSEERKAFRGELQGKRLEHYYDQAVRVVSVGYRLLKINPKGEASPNHPELPLLYSNANKTLRETGYDFLPKKSVMVVGLLSKLAPPQLSLKIKRGDQIVMVEEKPVHSEGEINEALKSFRQGEAVNVRFKRGLDEWEETLPIIFLEQEVKFAVDGKTGYLNAWTNALNSISVTTPMLRFVKTDDELAFILGHEIGHITEGHWLTTRVIYAGGATAGATVGQMIDQFAPGAGGVAGALAQAILTSPFSKEMEYDADRAALKYMKRGGFDLSQATHVFKRMAVEIPKTQKFSIVASHPATPERMHELEAMIEKGVP
ncbi:MAG: M48 family metalloprotease [Candidatus Omnitrophica bacterium]|nr:M48 family metalloprotease [Candidatus Omnitrophota bacterium]